MLGSVSKVEGACSEWITEHQERLEKAFRLASVRTEKEALRRQARSNLKATDTSLPVGARVYLRNRVKGRNKMQDVWDATPHKVIRRLDTGNTYVVVPLVALPDEEDSRKTVHRNDILHATQLADDMGLENSPVVGQDRSREDIYGNDVLLEAGTGNGVEETRGEEGSDDGEKDDDFELVVLPKQSSVPEDIPDGSPQQVLSDDLGQSQLETPGKDTAKSDQEPQMTTELAADPKEPDTLQTSTSGHEGAEVTPATLGQSQSETPGEDSTKSDQEPQITAELAVDAVADPQEPGTLQTSASEHEGVEVTPPTDDTKSSPPVRRSTRAGAGQHSNPHHLPRPVMREGMAATVTDSQILNSVAQSNLLIMQLLAKNAQV